MPQKHEMKKASPFILNILMIQVSVLMLISLCAPIFAEHFRPRGDEPEVRAILRHETDARAWIYHEGEHFHAIPQTKIGEEWKVEEIRRESVLFRRTSSCKFVEIPVQCHLKYRYHRNWSFLGSSIELWEAVEILAMGFGSNAVMYHKSWDVVSPAAHAADFNGMLKKVIPETQRFIRAGKLLLVIPAALIRTRRKEIGAWLKAKPADIPTGVYPGLAGSGTLLSRGNDIQFVLRQIALGSGVPVRFPETLHFPVFATFADTPFSSMLESIAFVNQCTIAQTAVGPEIQPLYEPIRPGTAFLTAEPFEPQTQGSGPRPPPPLPPF